MTHAAPPISQAELTGLRELRLTGGAPGVDLRPLAGKAGLTVVVSPWQGVLGSKVLDPSSTIVVADA